MAKLVFKPFEVNIARAPKQIELPAKYQKNVVTDDDLRNLKSMKTVILLIFIRVLPLKKWKRSLNDIDAKLKKM